MTSRDDIGRDDIRPGEIALPFDPAGREPDAGLVFIGRAQTPWRNRSACPHNMGQARERGQPAAIDVDADWRAGLAGLAAGDWIQVLIWADKARRDFGWVPVVGMDEAQARCLEYCRTLLANRESVDRPHWGWWVAILGGMTLTGVLALSPAAHAAWSEAVTVWTPRWLLGSIFAWAVLVHVQKGMVAVRLAERAGLHATSTAWGWQTFALGFASLRLLRRRAEANGD